MGKLEKFGRSILKKLGSSRSSSRRRREEATSTSSDEEDQRTRGIHKFQVVPPEDLPMSEDTVGIPEDRIGSPAGSEEGSAGYATDDTALSSLGPLDIKRVSVDYSESQGYYSNAELSPIPRIEVTVVRADLSSVGTVSPVPASQKSTYQRPMSPQVSPRSSIPADLAKDPTVPAHRPTSPQGSSRGTIPAHSEPRSTLPSYQSLRKYEDPTVSAHQAPSLPRTTKPAEITSTSPRGAPPVNLSKDPTVPLPTIVPDISNPKILGVTVPPPRITIEEDTVPTRTPIYTKKLPSQEYPRIDVRNRMSRKHEPIYKSSQLLNAPESLKKEPIERSATLSNLSAPEEEDPIDRFMKSHIYKTKMITTVFEAKDRGFEEISLDVIHEIDRWFESKNMMAVACELHWSVPREKRSRQLECKLKEKLLQALRENNKRLLYLRGMGHGKTPVKLAESNTVENISRDKETDSVRGIYQRSYTRLLPYLHKETPEWHSQYWTLQDIQSNASDDSIIQPDPQKFLFQSEPSDVLARNSLISLNIIGLSILGNSRKSCGSLFLQ